MKFRFKSLIMAFLISSVIGVGISYGKLYLFHIILLLLIFAYIQKRNNKKIVIFKKCPSSFHKFFYFMLIWYFFSLTWSISRLYSLQYLFYILCGISISLTIIYFAWDENLLLQIIKALSIPFIIEVVISLLESFRLFRYPISPFSPYVTYFAREMKIDMGLADNIVQELMQSPTGFQWNPNDLALAILMIFPFFFLSKNKILKIFGIISTAIIIVKSGSRGMFLALLFMIMIYFIFISKKKIIAISFFVILVSINIINANYLPNYFLNSENPRIREIAYSYSALISYIRFDSYNDNDSIGVRQQLIKNGLIGLKNSHYLGVGGGGSRALAERLGGIDGRVTSMHNFWIEVLVDSGIVFFIIFLIWYSKILIGLLRVVNHTKYKFLKYVASSCFLSMGGFLLGAIVPSSVIYFFPMWIMYGISIATINIYNKEKVAYIL